MGRLYTHRSRDTNKTKKEELSMDMRAQNIQNIKNMIHMIEKITNQLTNQREQVIEKLLEQNLKPSVRKFLKKYGHKLFYFGYKVRVEPQILLESQMINEKLTLLWCGLKIDSINFVISKGMVEDNAGRQVYRED